MAHIVKGKTPAQKGAQGKDKKKKIIIFLIIFLALLSSVAVPVGSIPGVRNIIASFGIPLDVQGNISFAEIFFFAFSNQSFAERYGYNTNLNYYADGGAYSGAGGRFAGYSLLSPFHLGDSALDGNSLEDSKSKLFNAREARRKMQQEGKEYPDMESFASADASKGHGAARINSLDLEAQSTVPNELALAAMGTGTSADIMSKDGTGAYRRPDGTEFFTGFGTESTFNKAMKSHSGKINMADNLGVVRRGRGGLNVSWDEDKAKGDLSRAYLYSLAANKSKYTEVKKELAELAFNGGEAGNEILFTTEMPSLETADLSSETTDLQDAQKKSKDCSAQRFNSDGAKASALAAIAAIGERPKCHRKCKNSMGLNRTEFNGKLAQIKAECKKQNAEIEKLNSMGCQVKKTKAGNCDAIMNFTVGSCDDWWDSFMGFMNTTFKQSDCPAVERTPQEEYDRTIKEDLFSTELDEGKK